MEYDLQEESSRIFISKLRIWPLHYKKAYCIPLGNEVLVIPQNQELKVIHDINILIRSKRFKERIWNNFHGKDIIEPYNIESLESVLYGYTFFDDNLKYHFEKDEENEEYTKFHLYNNHYFYLEEKFEEHSNLYVKDWKIISRDEYMDKDYKINSEIKYFKTLDEIL